MSYSVTVMNDSKILDNPEGGVIHSWLKFNDGSADADYFGFTPKNGWFDNNIRGKDAEGLVEDRNALGHRPPTETKTIPLTETQYRQMMQSIKQFKQRQPGYDLTPDGNGDANCTTAANQILQSGGIDYLAGLQTPFGVADRIKGLNNHNTLEDTLDAKDRLDERVEQLGTQTQKTLSGAVNDILNGARDAVQDQLENYLKSLTEPRPQANIDAAAALSKHLVSQLQHQLGRIGNHLAPMAQEGSPSARKYLQEALGYLRNLLNGPLQEAMNKLLDGALTGLNASPFGPGGLMPPLDGLPDIFGPPEGPDTGDSETAVDPIILDLDGDGIETLPLSKGVFFDHDENMFAESTGWVRPDDGLLVLDRNGDGRIDTGRELFGNHARLKDGKLADHGFLALKEQDDNGDGVLDAKDISWQKLQVWRDLNSDANVDEGELFTPKQVGVTSIDTHWKPSSFVDAQDHAHRQVGSITYSDGTKGQASDVWFTANKGHTRYTGDISVGEDIRRLPHIRGFGNMADLHVAMSQSPTLRALVEDYAADPQAAQQAGKMEKILFSWAGVTDIDPKSRGHYIDARQLAVLERASGKGFKHQWSGDTNPFIGSAGLLKAEYRKFAQHTEACLLAQTLYRNEFALIAVDIKPDFSGLTLNFDAFESHLNQLKGTDVVAHLRLRNAFHSFFSYHPTFSAEQERIGFPPQRTFIGGSDNDTLEGSRGDDILVGGAGDDYLEGGSGSDVYLFNRGDGKDVIAETSSESDDVDVLRFGEGISPEQVVVARRGGLTSSNYGDLELGFESGDERVTVKDFFYEKRHQIERVEFAEGTAWDVDAIKAMLLRGTEEAQTLWGYEEGSEIHGGGGDDRLNGNRGKDYLYGDAGDDTLEGGPEDDTLDGGVGNDVLRGENGNDRLAGGSGADRLDGGAGNDVLTGDEGNDTLEGGQGRDMLEGGQGNDRLEGGNGSDTYLFSRGGGQDVIAEHSSESGDADVLRFGEGITPEQVVVARRGGLTSSNYGDLALSLASGDDRVTVKDFFYEKRHQIERVEFAEGTAWDVDAIKAMLLRGTEEAQTLWGYEEGSEIHGAGGDDRLNGNKGKDYLYGDAGDDTLEGGPEDDTLDGGVGNDVLRGESGNDRLAGGSGADRLDGGAGNDVLTGDEGNDTLEGGQGNDMLAGGQGNDRLEGGNGSDTYLFSRGGGQDVIAEHSSESGDVDVLRFGEDITPEQVVVARRGGLTSSNYGDLALSLASGDDRVTVKDFFYEKRHQIERVEFAEGTAWDVDAIKAMLLRGTEEAQTLWGYEEGSEIHGAGGDDRLNGNKGKDYLYGDAGDDTLEGGPEDDTLDGGVGNDVLRGENGNDRLAGGSGADRLDGGAGNDVLTGDEGNDTLEGGQGNDMLAGGQGNDRLEGGNGSDTYLFSRGGGQDVIAEHSSESGDVDVLRFGEGISPEQVVVARRGGLTSSNYGDLALSLASGDDRVTVKDFFYEKRHQIERVEFAEGTAWDVDTIKAMLLRGTEEAQTLWGYEEGSEIHGAGGDDRLNGNKGKDYLYGDAGDDTLEGGPEDDTLDGGVGNDRLEGGSGSDVYLFSRGGGQDVIAEYSSESDDVDVLRFGEGITPEQVGVARRGGSTSSNYGDLALSLASGDDRVTVKDFFYEKRHQIERVEFAEGTAWDVDTLKAMLLRGTEEAQTLWGYEEGSEIHGGGGDDCLYGNKGKDSLYGDAGDDTLEGGTGDDTLDGGAGNDVLRGENGNDRLVGGSGADRLDGGAGNDVLTGDEGNDTLEGGTGDDCLTGGKGDDRLEGDGGNDKLMGGNGNDRLKGGTGNDILSGGTGKDHLEGGSGSDTYLFSRGGGQDVIAEHSSESGDVDVLKLSKGITPQQVTLQRRSGSSYSKANDLALLFQNSKDSVTIQEFFSAPRYQIERIEFADGTQWQSTDILNHIESGQALPTGKKGRLQRSVALMKQDIVQFMGWDEEDDASVSSVSLPLATAPSDQHRQQSSLAY